MKMSIGRFGRQLLGLAVAGVASVAAGSAFAEMGQPAPWEHTLQEAATPVMEIAIGIAFSPDILAKGTSKGYPVKGTFPSEGTGYEIGALGLVKGGPEPELGKKFIDWSLSKRAQDLMKVWFRIPLNPEAEIAAGATNASDVKLISYDDEWAGNNNKRLIEKWRQMIGK